MVVLNSLMNALVIRSQTSGVNFETLLSSNCCRQDVPIRANVSFSAFMSRIGGSINKGHTLADTNAKQIKESIEESFQSIEVEGVEIN